MRRQFYRYKDAMLPLALTAICFFACLGAGGFYPFGSKSISWCDMNQQVVPFMLDLKRVLEGKENLLFSLGNAGGMNFWGVFLFFAASPLSLLVYFVPASEMSLFMNVLAGIKLSLCAGSFSVLLLWRSPRILWYKNTLLSMMYAFCGYGMMFYQNIVWLDIMALFPLLYLSLERLFKDGRTGLYILTLSMTVAINFYLSYETVLFVILYAGLYLCMDRKDAAPGIGLRFLLSSAAAAGITAAVWLPAFLQYLSSARGGDLLGGLAGADFVTRLDTTLPLLFCTAAFVPVLFFFRKHLSDRRFAREALLLLAVLIPIVVEPVNRMWHTGSYQAFPVRYGYMAAALILLLLDRILVRSPRAASRPLGKTQLWMTAALMIALCAAAGLVVTRQYKALSRYATTLWGNDSFLLWTFVLFVILGAGYLLVTTLLRRGRLAPSAAGGFAALLLITEIAAGFTVYYTPSARSAGKFQQVIDLAGRIEDDRFYRVKDRQKDFEVNLIGAIGYPTIAHYSSLTTSRTLSLMKKLGFSSYWMEIGSSGGTAFSDALLSTRYQIEKVDGSEGEREVIYQNRSYQITELANALPPCIVTGEDLSAWEELPEGIDRFAIQSQIAETLFGEDSLFESFQPISVTGLSIGAGADQKTSVSLDSDAAEGSLCYIVTVDEPRILYFDCFDRISNSLREKVNNALAVTVNGVSVTDRYPTQSFNGILELGRFEEETVTVEVKVAKSFSCTSFGLFGLDPRRVGALTETAAGGDLQVDGCRMAADVSAREGDWLFIAVCYDEGFSATVNGKETEVYPVFDGFMAVRLEEGENQVVLRFFPKGLKGGLILSAAALLLTGLALFFLRRRFSLSGLRRSELAAEAAVYLLFGLVLAAVYAGPIFLNLLA